MVLYILLSLSLVSYVSIRFLSPLKYFFQFSIMFILLKSGTGRSFISFVLMYFL